MLKLKKLIPLSFYTLGQFHQQTNQPQKMIRSFRGTSKRNHVLHVIACFMLSVVCLLMLYSSWWVIQFCCESLHTVRMQTLNENFKKLKQFQTYITYRPISAHLNSHTSNSLVKTIYGKHMALKYSKMETRMKKNKNWKPETEVAIHLAITYALF